MADRFPWFPFYVDDWLNDERVRMMSFEERGAYLELLCFQWREGSIPSDSQGIASLLGVNVEFVKSLMDTVLKCFTKSEGRLVNSRLEIERKKQRAKHRKVVAAGRKGGKAKAAKALDGTNRSSEAKAALEHRSTIQSQSQSQSQNKKKRQSQRVSTEPLFSDPTPSDSESSLSQSFLGIPDLLVPLELYREDDKLTEKLPSLLPVWVKAYPEIDVEAEILKAHAWELANPSKRKKNRPRFLSGWLNRQQKDADRDRRAQQGPRDPGERSIDLDLDAEVRKRRKKAKK